MHIEAEDKAQRKESKKAKKLAEAAAKATRQLKTSGNAFPLGHPKNPIVEGDHPLLIHPPKPTTGNITRKEIAAALGVSVEKIEDMVVGNILPA